MGRPFFKDDRGVLPDGPMCSSCGRPNPTKYDDYSENYFCDKQCYVDWFVEEKAEEHAWVLADERLFEVYERKG